MNGEGNQVSLLSCTLGDWGLFKGLIEVLKKGWKRYWKRKKAEWANFACVTTYRYYGDVTEEELRALEEMIGGYKDNCKEHFQSASGEKV